MEGSGRVTVFDPLWISDPYDARLILFLYSSCKRSVVKIIQNCSKEQSLVVVDMFNIALKILLQF